MALKPAVFHFSHIIVRSEEEFVAKYIKPEQRPSKGRNTLIILIGPPSSGKTTFANKYFNDYAILSYKRGSGSFNTLMQEFKSRIQKDKFRIVIDTINTDGGLRRKFI